MLKQDLCPAALEELCRSIRMPESVTERVTTLAAAYDFTAAEDFYQGPFSVETGNAAVEGLKEAFGEEGADGLLMLTVMLAGALKARRDYKEKGIPEQIWLDTMGCFSRFVREDQVSYGRDCFTRAFWAYRQLSLKLFRIGTLEYEMTTLRDTGAELTGLQVQPGDPVLSVHIPSDALLTRKELDASYAGAKTFFARFYPSYDYRCACCCSWLLSPSLKELLQPGSRILLFQSDFIPTGFYEDNGGYKTWLFKNGALEPEDFPENTSLQRRAKAFVLAGGKIGEGSGILRPGIL